MPIDKFQAYKELHVRFDKDTFVELKIKLFRKNLSIQEFFKEIARKYVEDSFAIDQIIDRYLAKKMQEEIDYISMKKEINKIKYESSEKDIIYNMIKEQLEAEKERLKNEENDEKLHEENDK